MLITKSNEYITRMKSENCFSYLSPQGTKIHKILKMIQRIFIMISKLNSFLGRSMNQSLKTNYPFNKRNRHFKNIWSQMLNVIKNLKSYFRLYTINFSRKYKMINLWISLYCFWNVSDKINELCYWVCFL